MGRLVQNSQPVTSDEDGTLTTPPLALTGRVFHLPDCLLGKAREFIYSVIGGYRQENRAFGRVKAQCTRGDIWASKFANTEETNIGTRPDVVSSHVFIANVVNLVSVNCESGPLAFELENYEAAIMT